MATPLTMSKTVRIIIFYTFLFLFLISAPVLILYTSGYRYSIKHGRIEQLGALILKSIPRDATIKINNEEVKEKTPAFLKILPDEYQVEVQKEGYNAWSKILPVTSRETTFAEDIILWKISEPTRVAGRDLATALDTIITNDFHFAINVFDIGLNQYQVQVYNLLLNKETLLFSINSTAKPDIKLSNSGSMALIKTMNGNDKTLTTLRFEPVATTTLSKSITDDFENLKWGDTDGTLYGFKDGKLFAINLYNNRIDPIARTDKEYAFRNTTIWSVNYDDAIPKFRKSDASSANSEPETIFELPNETYEFLDIEDPYLLLHEKNNDKLLVINTRSINDGVITLSGKHAVLRTNKNGEKELLHSNDFEIWKTNLNNKNSELIRRQSNKLNNVVWYLQDNYIIFASGDKIETIEIDGLGERNITTLATMPNLDINQVVIDAQSNSMFFGTAGTGGGVFKLEL